MIKFKITFSKSKIIDKVSLNTAYTGAKNAKESGYYDRVATIKADRVLLESLVGQSAGLLMERLKDFITVPFLGGDEISFTLELSGAFDESLIPSVTNDLEDVLVTATTAAWMRIADVTKAENWERETSAILQRGIAKLCHRRRPVRGNQS